MHHMTHDTLPPSSTDPLLGFRLAYLRAMAHSWRNKEFQKELLALPDIQPILAKKFGLQSRWPGLNIRLSLNPDKARQTQWMPDLTGGWIGRDGTFVITLPQAPKADAAQALAAYYQQFPVFMGPAIDCLADLSDGAWPTGLGIPGGGPESLLAFGGVVLRAVALAWKSDQFQSELTRDQVDATPVLSQWLGYNLPFNFELLFVRNPAFTWDASSQKWNLLEPGGAQIKNSIVLNYPVPPADETMRPIALTAYNNTGSAYPFTC
jgi:ribosomally synthesized peptide (two-chain TOMM family)